MQSFSKEMAQKEIVVFNASGAYTRTHCWARGEGGGSRTMFAGARRGGRGQLRPGSAEQEGAVVGFGPGSV